MNILQRTAFIKKYIEKTFVIQTQAHAKALLHNRSQRLPNIYVSPMLGKLLSMLVQIQRPQRVLEIGTLGGYSTLWIAKHLKGGYILSVELYKHHQEIASENIMASCLDCHVDVVCANALDYLTQLQEKGATPFDYIFIDGNKREYLDYLEKVLPLTRKGSIIISDNLIPKRGNVGYPQKGDVNAQAIYDFHKAIANHPKLESIIFPTIVGQNGRIDGCGLSIVQ